MKRQSIIRAAVLGLCFSLLVGKEAFAYNFTKIADTSSDSLFSQFDGFSMNDGGTVAFRANLNGGGQGIFTGNGIVPLSAIAQTSDGFREFSSSPSINNSGLVAFSAKQYAMVNMFGEYTLVHPSGIFTSNGVTTTTIAQSDPFSRYYFTGGWYDFSGTPSIDNNGTVAFKALIASYYGSQEIVIGNGNSTTKIASGGGYRFGGIQVNNPLITDAGTVVYGTAESISYPYPGGYSKSTSILTSTGITIAHDSTATKPSGYDEKQMNWVMTTTREGTAIVNSDGSSTRLFNPSLLSANNTGRVAFGANLGDEQTAGIFSGNGTNTNLIADTTGLFSKFGVASINDGGTVAFQASLDEGGDGIFTGSNPLTDKVIKIGDFLFGSTVQEISLDKKSLNSSGQISFWAKLANGISGIFRADPEAGESQSNPLMPQIIESNVQKFENVQRRQWYDPPAAYGFRYQMTSDSLFTSILNFPTGFKNPFTVSVGDRILGEFLPGDAVDFVSLLGTGVSEFTIAGITPFVDGDNPKAFPIQLDFNTETASFNMQALQSEKVPEPSAVLSLLAIGAGVALKRKRKNRLAV